MTNVVLKVDSHGFGNTLFLGFCTAHCFIPYLRSFKRNKCCVHGNKIKRWKKGPTVSKRCSLSSIWIKMCEWDLYKTTRKLFNLGTGYPVILLMYQIELNKFKTIIFVVYKLIMKLNPKHLLLSTSVNINDINALWNRIVFLSASTCNWS